MNEKRTRDWDTRRTTLKTTSSREDERREDIQIGYDDSNLYVYSRSLFGGGEGEKGRKGKEGVRAELRVEVEDDGGRESRAPRDDPGLCLPSGCVRTRGQRCPTLQLQAGRSRAPRTIASARCSPRLLCSLVRFNHWAVPTYSPAAEVLVGTTPHLPPSESRRNCSKRDASPSFRPSRSFRAVYELLIFRRVYNDFARSLIRRGP